MLVQRASAEVIGGRLQVQIDLQTKGGPGSGDKPGHPFRGNQWDGRGGSGGGDHVISESEVSDWLSDSVNKDITYHATSSESVEAITKDGVDVERSTAGGLIFGQGFYTSTSQKDAMSQSNVPGAGVVRVAIKTKNPVDLISDPSKWTLLSDIGGGFTQENAARIRKELIKRGYDGIIMPGSGGAKVVVALTNESVKVVKE